MKIALCFIINYEHILVKEHIWREWIEPNKDIINVYFFYDDYSKIKSEWIRQHALPSTYCNPQKTKTSYYYVIPAYISLMRFATRIDSSNQWFCFLTDSCCPIISPKRFRYLFFKYYAFSIFSWKTSWWNVEMHKRANLRLLPYSYHLANDPWFVLNRQNVYYCLSFLKIYPDITKIVCEGGLANESLFAIMLYQYKQIDHKDNNILKQSNQSNQNIINQVTHATDWERMSSATSPHIFTEGNKTDKQFIEKNINNEQFVMFIRKISLDFPDELLRYYIYEYNKKQDDLLVIDESLFHKIHIYIVNKLQIYSVLISNIICFIFVGCIIYWIYK